MSNWIGRCWKETAKNEQILNSCFNICKYVKPVFLKLFEPRHTNIFFFILFPNCQRKFWEFWKTKFWQFEKEILTVWKGKFWQFGKGNFDSLKRRILTIWKGKFWQFGKGKFDILKWEILTVFFFQFYLLSEKYKILMR
jgi:hypothetical protein